jgi:hypothetical protein
VQDGLESAQIHILPTAPFVFRTLHPEINATLFVIARNRASTCGTLARRSAGIVEENCEIAIPAFATQIIQIAP